MSHSTASQRHTIAWFTKSLVEAQRSSSSWEAMTHLAQDHNFNLLTLVGGMLKSPIGFEAQSNLLYEFVNPTNVDGLIVTGGLSHHIGREGLQQFCAHYHPLPVVSLETLVEGVPSIVPDFYSGMYALIRHLVEDHGHRRIAFIRDRQIPNRGRSATAPTWTVSCILACRLSLTWWRPAPFLRRPAQMLCACCWMSGKCHSVHWWQPMMRWQSTPCKNCRRADCVCQKM